VQNNTESDRLTCICALFVLKPVNRKTVLAMIIDSSSHVDCGCAASVNVKLRVPMLELSVYPKILSIGKPSTVSPGSLHARESIAVAAELPFSPNSTSDDDFYIPTSMNTSTLSTRTGDIN
jgi:hypothetical protein